MIQDLEDLEPKLENYRNKKYTVVFTNGCFDILHKGHVDYLNKAKSLGDVLIVGLNSDHSVRQLKGEKRPIVSAEERGFLLENLKAVDCVVVFDEETPKKLIETISPSILVKGGDYTIETIVGAKHVLEQGGKVEIIPYIDGSSTTTIIDRIRERY